MQSFYLPHRWLPTKQILALHRFSLRWPSLSLPRLPCKRQSSPFPLFDTGIPSPSNQSYDYNVFNSNQANKALNVAHIAAGGWNKIEKNTKQMSTGSKTPKTPTPLSLVSQLVDRLGSCQYDWPPWTNLACRICTHDCQPCSYNPVAVWRGIEVKWIKIDLDVDYHIELIGYEMPLRSSPTLVLLRYLTFIADIQLR